MKPIYVISTFLFLVFSANGQGIQFDKANIQIDPVLNFQGWATYTTGAEIYNQEKGLYEPVEDRINFQLRRTHIGFKAKAYDRFKLSFVGSADFVGRDVFSGVVGGANNGSNPFFRVWVANLSWKASSSDLLHFTFGYMPPQVSRESISSALRISSFEKAWSQNYIRRHLVGIGPGRAIGLNLGGMQNWAETKVALTYNVGIFNPTRTAFGGNSAGITQAPLLAYRLALHFGDPEFSSYSTGRKSNYLGKRKGITIAVSGSQNGEMATWETSQSIGFDILLNWKNFNLSGEWMRLYRDAGSALTSTAYTGFVRASYNIIAGAVIFEPAVTYMIFDGESTRAGQDAAIALGTTYGEESYIDITLNAYLNANTKLSLAYILRDGDPGFYDQGSTANNYFVQGGVGPFHRGDYLGLGFVFIFGK